MTWVQLRLRSDKTRSSRYSALDDSQFFRRLIFKKTQHIYPAVANKRNRNPRQRPKLIFLVRYGVRVRNQGIRFGFGFGRGYSDKAWSCYCGYGFGTKFEQYCLLFYHRLNKINLISSFFFLNQFIEIRLILSHIYSLHRCVSIKKFWNISIIQNIIESGFIMTNILVQSKILNYQRILLFYKHTIFD